MSSHCRASCPALPASPVSLWPVEAHAPDELAPLTSLSSAYEGAHTVVSLRRLRTPSFVCEVPLGGQGWALEVVNKAGNETEDLLADLTSIIHSVCAQLYGQRRAKRKTETVIRALETGENEAEHAIG